MPRGNGSGGPRTGAPGAAYANRSDLTQAPTAAPGQPYGVAGAQLASQQALPLPQAPPVGVAPVPAPPTPMPAPTPGAPPAAPSGPPVAPGSLGELAGPTARPNEPVHAGSPLGPGPGPEALATPNPLVKAAAVLNQIGEPDAWTSKIRDQVNAMLGNQGAV